MVVPIGLITGVFTAIAKTKAKSWKAMKGAMGAVKSAAGPMASIASALKVFAPIILVISALFKVLGASILKTVLPTIQSFLDMLTSPVMLALMEDIGEIIGIVLIPMFQILTTVLELVVPVLKIISNFIKNVLIGAWDLLVDGLKKVGNFIKNVLIGAWDLLVGGLKFVGNAFIWFINSIINGINFLMNSITLGIWGDIPTIPYLQKGTPYVPRTGPYILHRGEEVIPADKKGRGEIHVHIDLRNAVVDNVDRLSQKIAEQVLIQIG